MPCCSLLHVNTCSTFAAFLANHISVDFENNGNYYPFYDDESEDNDPGDNQLVPAEQRIIGSELSDVYYGGSTEADDDVLEGFADEVMGAKAVQWLTDPGNEELQVNFIAVSIFPFVRDLSPNCSCCSGGLRFS